MERLTETRTEAGLYELHRRELTRFATTLVGVTDAADVVSDAMESLLKSGKLLEARNPSALMHRTVFAKARSMQRTSFDAAHANAASSRNSLSPIPSYAPMSSLRSSDAVPGNGPASTSRAGKT